MPKESPFPREVNAIRTLRSRFLKMGAYKLARKIHKRDFMASTEQNSDCVLAALVNAPTRTFYSILSVIRRFDALKKPVKAAA